jgi:molecular chaperone HtpG
MSPKQNRSSEFAMKIETGAQLTAAEIKALEAQAMPPFQDFNLLGIKSSVADALKLIGRNGIFGEYTLHDISHVDKMLTSLDWLIPPSTAADMTAADWLMIVLAIYFHDLGMLVTEAEFEARAESDFPTFCEHELFAGDAGTDYRSKLSAVEDEDRFLYEEYVRAHHADRVGQWIRGKVTPRHGLSEDACSAVTAMLGSLPSIFREDLAMVCESHHRSDLDDLEKYSLSQPYGDSEDATANLQYAALILRSADLLHITSDRCPSMMFRLIDPHDPISQREWAQQTAVRRIRPQASRDEDGNIDNTVQRDTIEVFALFTNSEAFFGLKAYLAYARSELQQSANWADLASGAIDRNYEFPWRHIDSSNVQADGFLDRQLSFSLDQERILDLLTGHTLYNDTSVVLRELVQNSLDAVRLQACIDGGNPEDYVDDGLVEIEWTDSTRELVVRDNGTGMTQNVIERNLLRAGASRYQEEGFRRQYPSFSPISRFGIGVLSTFMIADAVTVTTCSKEEEKVRQLTLRTVHGDYLVSLLDKESDPTALRLAPHGTEVRLRIRESADLKDIRTTLAQWIVVPRTKVLMSDNGDEPRTIGFKSPRDAIETVLRAAEIELYEGGNPNDQTVKVVETSHQGVQTAVALRWSNYRRRWAFLKINDRTSSVIEDYGVGTCVEGIRVEDTTAGFSESHVVGLADARGLGAPKTNVARSDLDATAERRSMLQGVYRAYLSHVTDECERLHLERGASLTWAAQEASSLLEQLLYAPDRFGSFKGAKPVDWLALKEEMRQQPLVLIEEKESREIRTVVSIDKVDMVWTVDSALLRAAEGILREVPVQGSLHALSSGFGTDVFALPDGVTLVGFHPGTTISQDLLEEREVGNIVIDRDRRRIDLGWVRKDSDPLWIGLGGGNRKAGPYSPSDRVQPVFVATREVPITGRAGDSAIRAFDGLFLFSDTPLAEWLRRQVKANRGQIDGERRLDTLTLVVESFFERLKKPQDLSEFVEKIFEKSSRADLIKENGLLDEIVSVLDETPNSVFHTWASYRGNLHFD